MLYQFFFGTVVAGTLTALVGAKVLLTAPLLATLPFHSPDAYYLVNRAHTDQDFKKSFRHSHRMTRFDLERQPSALRTPWHSMTCTELLVVDRATGTSDQHAALVHDCAGTRLAWDGRTSRPGTAPPRPPDHRGSPRPSMNEWPVTGGVPRPNAKAMPSRSLTAASIESRRRVAAQ